MKIISKNRRAFYDYEIFDKFEAGISLLGSEIKSIRENRVSLKGSFISFSSGEAIWKNGQIQNSAFSSNNKNHEVERERKLLLHKKEINKIIKNVEEKGYTVVVLSMGLLGGNAKLNIALAKGKKNYDKRHSLKEKDIERRMKLKY